MGYRLIKYDQAKSLISKGGVRSVEQIEQNFATVYQLSDYSYLIVPINPFGKCLLLRELKILQKWIKEEYFPTNEDVNKFYFDNKSNIENLESVQRKLVAELEEYLIKECPTQINIETPEGLDSAFKIFKKKKSFSKFKLNFIVAVAQYLMKRYPTEKYELELLKTKQLLNPVVTLVLVKRNKGLTKFFKLEEMIDGKRGYSGLEYIEMAIKQFWFTPSEFELVGRS